MLGHELAFVLKERSPSLTMSLAEHVPALNDFQQVSGLAPSMTVLAHALSDCLKHGMSLEQCPPVPRLTKRAQSLTELAPALTEGESELPLWGPDRACSVTYRARSVLSD